MSEEQELLLQVLRRYKAERAYHQAVTLTLQMLGQTPAQSSIAVRIEADIRDNESSCSGDVDVRFRDIESQLLSGRDLRTVLRSLAERMK